MNQVVEWHLKVNSWPFRSSKFNLVR